ncbi:class I SAM-dependent methyltransferase [Magnetococcales bacterium HHB-1]
MKKKRASHGHLYWGQSDIVSVYEQKDDLFEAEQKLFKRHIAPGDRLLDVGCSTGRVSKNLVGLCSYIKGVDYSEEMLEIYRKVLPGLDTACLSMDQLSEEEASYDVVLIPYNSLDYVSSKASRLETLARVHAALKPGGKLIFSSHNPLGSLGIWLYCRHPGTLLREFFRLLSGESFKREGYFKNRLFKVTFQHYFGRPHQIIQDTEACGFRYLESMGGNLASENRLVNRLLETWVYYAFQKKLIHN